MPLHDILDVPIQDADTCESLFNQLCAGSESMERRREIAEALVGTYSWTESTSQKALEYLIRGGTNRKYRGDLAFLKTA